MSTQFSLDSLHAEALCTLLDADASQLPDSVQHALDDFIDRIGGVANAILAVQMLGELE